MAFSNLEVDIAGLPRASELRLHSLPPAHRREILAQSLITVAIVLLPSLIPLFIKTDLGLQPARFIPAVLVILFGGLFTALALVRYRHKGYALRAHDVVFRTGLFWRKTTVLPFDRVQHAEVTQGPLQRRFGVATLKFYTAGGSSVDLKIESLLEDDAERLRETVLERSGHGD